MYTNIPKLAALNMMNHFYFKYFRYIIRKNCQLMTQTHIFTEHVLLKSFPKGLEKILRNLKFYNSVHLIIEKYFERKSNVILKRTMDDFFYMVFCSFYIASKF